jgi:hypothetical protein
MQGRSQLLTVRTGIRLLSHLQYHLNALQYTDSWTEIEMTMLTPSETGCKIGTGGKGIATLRAVQVDLCNLDSQDEGLMKVRDLRSSRRVLIRYTRRA